ncbi:MAG TPA: biopolymer transporter ExbD [Candidatus Methylomirabilis sp.]
MAMSLPSRSPDRRVLSEINVTPMVDVMLVLLVIFMVTAPMLQRGTDVQLPQAQHSEVKEQERLTLTLARDGRIYLNGEEVPRAALRDRLISATRGRERTVQFRGDARVPYGLVIEVMDTLRDAGIENVGMITERPSAPKG